MFFLSPCVVVRVESIDKSFLYSIALNFLAYQIVILIIRTLLESFSLILDMTHQEIASFIEIDSSKRFGKPVLKGTRISVYDILNWMANGMTRKEILQDFPEISEESISACLHYAATKESNIKIAS